MKQQLDKLRLKKVLNVKKVENKKKVEEKEKSPFSFLSDQKQDDLFEQIEAENHKSESFLMKSNIEFQMDHKETVDKARVLIKKAMSVHKEGD